MNFENEIKEIPFNDNAHANCELRSKEVEEKQKETKLSIKETVG